MLSIESLVPGDIVDLKEVANQIGVKDSRFEAISTHPGGMGFCIHLKNLENLKGYALKCVRPDLVSNNNTLDRFYDEIDVWLSASACDAIVEAIAVVRINEIPAILSTWMDGGDLSNSISKLDASHKFETIIRTVRALSWVQSTLGVIHRDLKPANILLDKELLAYISDWGLARPISQLFLRENTETAPVVIERPDRTQIGSFLGTVIYASPEQIKNAVNVDHRSDIYSLGCIMYEMETGSPPFSGSSIPEIAYQHIHTQARKLGGGWSRTTLGLEYVIDRCLSKTPDDRYSTYQELEDDLLDIASKKGFPIGRCKISTRYKRYPLGKGHIIYDQIFRNLTLKSETHGVMELDQVEPFLVEAENLMALGRYIEAEKFLRPLYIPDFLEEPSVWHFGHTITENYAFCLQNIADRLDEALVIFGKLNSMDQKPAEFYVNYSLAILKSRNWTKALDICQAGLTLYPRDYDLLGNYTISLRNSGDFEKAYENAKQRLLIRQDVHSIEEMVSVLQAKRDKHRNNDLPEAIKIAEVEYGFIKEGLKLTPNFPSLKISEIQFLIFINANAKVIEACQKMINDEHIPSTYRQIAFVEMVDLLGEGEHFKTALDLIDKQIGLITDEYIKKRLMLVKMRTYADKFMIGFNSKEGERVVIREVVDFFLTKDGGKYIDELMAARVLEWLGNVSEAEYILRDIINSSPNEWKARKELVLLLQRRGCINDAVTEANRFVNICPWRTESYDTLNYIAQKAGNFQLSGQVKLKGDNIFAQEMTLFDCLKKSCGF